MYLYLEMIKRSIEGNGLGKEGCIRICRVPAHWKKIMLLDYDFEGRKSLTIMRQTILPFIHRGIQLSDNFRFPLISNETDKHFRFLRRIESSVCESQHFCEFDQPDETGHLAWLSGRLLERFFWIRGFPVFLITFDRIFQVESG